MDLSVSPQSESSLADLIQVVLFLTLMKINWSLDVLLMLIYFLQLQKAHISIGSLNWNIQPKSSLSRQGHFFLSRSYPEEGTAQRAVASNLSGKSLWTTPVNDRLLSSLSESPTESFPHQIWNHVQRKIGISSPNSVFLTWKGHQRLSVVKSLFHLEHKLIN